MENKDPMLQKAAGWLLKESSKYHKEEVVKFLIKWKSKAPRLTLRYACEKLPKKDKKEVLN